MTIDVTTAIGRRHLIDLMNIWARQESSVRLDDLCKALQVKRHSFMEWLKDYSDLYDAYYPIKMLLAKRRKIQTRENRKLIVVPRGKSVDPVSDF